MLELSLKSVTITMKILTGCWRHWLGCKNIGWNLLRRLSIPWKLLVLSTYRKRERERGVGGQNEQVGDAETDKGKSVCVCVCVRERERRERETHMFKKSTRQRHLGSIENVSCVWLFAEIVMWDIFRNLKKKKKDEKDNEKKKKTI